MAEDWIPDIWWQQGFAPERMKVDEKGKLGARAIAKGTVENRLELGDLIAQGSVGAVHIGLQQSLRREVAIKRLRPDRADSLDQRMLLAEAWISGRLEHPNVVPIHDLQVDDKGNPLIVMKRIHGTAWSEVLADPAHPILKTDGREPLEYHLTVLSTVCQTMAYAHSRGILHRDLKPENVMIGEFGEIYIVDWGLALSTDPGLDHLPLASEVKEVAGTPDYMAPEQVRLEPIGPWTDVYLLGAIIYRIITNKPPHIGDLRSKLRSALENKNLVFADDVPEELTALCRKAMDPEPTARFRSTSKLRLAILAFLRQRESRRLGRDAQRALTDVHERMQARAPDADIHRAFGACQAAFDASRRAWPDNREAEQGRDEALRLMASYALDHGDPRHAARWLSQLSRPDPALQSRQQELHRTLSATQEHYARLSARVDPRTGRRGRVLMLAAVGLISSGALLGFSLLSSLGTVTLTYPLYGGVLVGVGVAAAALQIVARRTLRTSLVNTQVALLPWGTLLAASLTGWAGQELELEPLLVTALAFLQFGTLALFTAASGDRRMSVIGGLCVVGFVPAMLWPENCLMIFGNALLLDAAIHLFLEFRPRPT